MALTLDNSIATNTANSYVDVAYCDDYWNVHYNQTKAAQWSALNADQKASLLIQACRVIERARFTTFVRLTDANYPLRYDRRARTIIQLDNNLTPVKWYYYQTLQFPRNLDRRITDGTLFIPEPIKMAQCEQAVYLLNLDETALASRLQGITNDIVTVGQIHTRQEFNREGVAFAPMALEFIGPFLLRSSSKARRG